MSVSEPFPEQFHDDLLDSDFLLEPKSAPSPSQAEEYQPDAARPDLLGHASEADVVEQAFMVGEDLEFPDAE